MALLGALCRLLLFNLVIVKGYLSNSPHIITFWGQDPSIKDADNVVRALNKTCGKSSYTTVVIGFVNKSFKNKTTASLPPMHCIKSKRSKTKLSLYCPEIAKKVEQCQKNNRKVLIGVGGPNETLYFDDANSAQYFAKKIWNWFLGGTEVSEMRPFGGIKLDGVNLFLKDSGSKHLDVFLRTLDELSGAQPGVKYTYTMSVPCNNPDLYFGEGKSKLSKDKIVPLIKQVYVRYAGKPCCKDGPKHFRGELHEWKGFSADPNRPELFVLFPRNPHTTMTNCFSSPRQLRILNNMISLKNNLAEYIAETKMSYLKKAKSLIRAKHETAAAITRSTSLNKIFTQEGSDHQTRTNPDNHTNIDLKQQTEEANSKLFQLNKKIAAFRANLRNNNKDIIGLLNEYDHEKEHINYTASDIDVSNQLKEINSLLKKTHANSSVSDDDGSNHLKEVNSKQKKEHANSSASDDETSSQLKEIEMLEKEQVRNSPSDHDALNQLKEEDSSQESAPTNRTASDDDGANQMKEEESNQMKKSSNKSLSNHPVKIKLDLSVTLHNARRKGEQTKDDPIHFEENKSFEQLNGVPKMHEILLNDMNDQPSDNVVDSRKKPDVKIDHKEVETAVDHGNASVEVELKDVEETKPVKQENSGAPKMHEFLLNDDMEEKSHHKHQKEINSLAETGDDNDLEEQPHHNLLKENKTVPVKSNDTNETPNPSNMNSDFENEKEAKDNEKEAKDNDATLDEAKSPVRQHQSSVLKQKMLLLNDDFDRTLYDNLRESDKKLSKTYDDDNDKSNEVDDENDNDINLSRQTSDGDDIVEHQHSNKIKRKKSMHHNMNNNNVSSEILISEANEIPTNESLNGRRQKKKTENDFNKDYVNSKKKHRHMNSYDIYSKEKHHNRNDDDVSLETLISEANEIPTNESFNERRQRKEKENNSNKDYANSKKKHRHMNNYDIYSNEKHRNRNNDDESLETLYVEANEIPTNESLNERRQRKRKEYDMNKDYANSKKKHRHTTNYDINSKEKHHNRHNGVKLVTPISQPNEIPTNESLNARKGNKKNDHLHPNGISENETEELKPVDNNYQGFSENQENPLDEDDDSNVDLKEFGFLDEEDSGATDHNTKQNFDNQKLSTHVHKVGSGDTPDAENEAGEDDSSGQNSKLVNEYLKSRQHTPQVGSGASDIQNDSYNQNTKQHKKHQKLKQKYHEGENRDSEYDDETSEPKRKHNKEDEKLMKYDNEEENSASEADNETSEPKRKHDKEDNKLIKYDNEEENSASEADNETSEPKRKQNKEDNKLMKYDKEEENGASEADSVTSGQNSKHNEKDQKKEKFAPEEGSGTSEDDIGTSAQKEQELKKYESDEENGAAGDDNETSEKHDKQVQKDKKLQQYEELRDASDNDNEQPRQDSNIVRKENKPKKYDNEEENVASGDVNDAFKQNSKHVKKNSKLKKHVHDVGSGESEVGSGYSDRNTMRLENKLKSKERIHKAGSENAIKNERFKTKLSKHIYPDNVPEKHIPINEKIVQKLVHRKRSKCNPNRPKLCDKKYNLLGINEVSLTFLDETKRKHKKSTSKEADSNPSHITSENNRYAYRNHHKHSNKRMSKRRTANKGSRSNPSQTTEAYDKNAVKNRDKQSNSKLHKLQKTEKTETNGLDVKVSSIKMKEVVNRTKQPLLPVAGYYNQVTQIAPQSAATSAFETKPLVNLSTYSPETPGYITPTTNTLPQSTSISETKPLVNRHVNAGKKKKTKKVTRNFAPKIDDIDIEIQPYKKVDKSIKKRNKHKKNVASYSNKTTAYYFKPAIDDIDMEFVIGNNTRK